MAHSSNYSGRSLWFTFVVPMLAIATTGALFLLAGINPYDPPILSAKSLIYILCWFALERIYAYLLRTLIALIKQMPTTQQ